MHCENYNFAFPLCEVYQDTFPVSPEMDDWPSTGGCPGTILNPRISQRLVLDEWIQFGKGCFKTFGGVNSKDELKSFNDAEEFCQNFSPMVRAPQK